jgi:hypothetical protein
MDLTAFLFAIWVTLLPLSSKKALASILSLQASAGQLWKMQGGKIVHSNARVLH